ncbi:GGDEF domain-containing protein [Psychrobacter sp. NZS113]|uniref:GGDEF domain-containing protein n=1 Tax=Psychrobacter sp. NZS113 TaxID=2792045 RepID=UPI0018CD144A|nr:GGDEF domain-containing protein [Psychrobacter sp. NZS113]MBH0096772.1 GGDEF domain-containing protein [Psychrobacter sp. NZS113]
MAVSKFYLGYKQLSKAVFEWQAADRTALLAAFMVMDVFSHWLWCLFVWYRRDAYSNYIDMNLLYPIWIGVSVVGVFLLWMSSRFSPVRKAKSNIYTWQAILITIYSAYITFIVAVLGHSSLVAGVSLVGGTMLGMMLISRRYVWRAFIGQIIAILVVTLIPYVGITIPNLRQMIATTLPPNIHSYVTYSEMAMMKDATAATVLPNGRLNWDSVNYLRQSSNLLWRSTHIYMSLPKAIFIIYMFRTLLVILDDSRKETLQHANQDELTQLKNRRYGLMQMKQALVTIEESQDISVILLDLDWFKEVNDNYGHDVGDRVLITVAQTLSQSLTDDTIVSRYGGEEFLIVLPNTKHDSAMVIAEQLRLSIAEQTIMVDDNITFNVTASLGLYTLTYKECMSFKKANRAAGKTETGCQLDHSQLNKSYIGKTFDNQTELTQLPQDICQRLICRADKALYKAKSLGRNQVVSANEMSESGDDKIDSLYSH